MDKSLHGELSTRFGSVHVEVTPTGRCIVRKLARLACLLAGIGAAIVFSGICFTLLLTNGYLPIASICLCVAAFSAWRCWPRRNR